MTKTEEITRKKFNNLKRYYDETWDKKNHTLHVGFFGDGAKTLSKSYKDATKNLIKKLNSVKQITKDSLILDVGCGTGKTLIYLCKRYDCKGVGVDISDEMIKDAKKFLTKINKYNKKNLNIKFIRGSGSELAKLLKSRKKFTHMISQDALFLVNNKKKLFEGISLLLQEEGAFVIDDFLSTEQKKSSKKKEKELVYRLVNWSEGLSFNMYKKILASNKLKLVCAKRMDKDMVKTYTLLAKRLKRYASSKDPNYKNLYERYKAIANNVRQKKMGWGIFVGLKK